MQSGPNVNTGSGIEPSATEADLIRTTERERLRAMVEADMEVANQLHADDFQLVNPGGGVLSKEEYLGFIAAGDVDYLVWEPISEIAVRLYGVNTAVIHYQSQTESSFSGKSPPSKTGTPTSMNCRTGSGRSSGPKPTTIAE